MCYIYIVPGNGIFCRHSSIHSSWAFPLDIVPQVIAFEFFAPNFFCTEHFTSKTFLVSLALHVFPYFLAVLELT